MLWASSGVSLTTVALMLLPSVGGVSASSKSASRLEFCPGFLVIIVPRVWHLRCGGGDHGSLAALKLLADPMRRRRPALSPRR